MPSAIKTFRQAKPNTRRFAEYAVNEFDPATIAEVLIASPGTAFFGERVVAFAGLCAWVMAPTDETFIRDAMILKMLEKYQRIVERHKSKIRMTVLARERSAQASEKYASFLTQLRQPLLSERAQLECRSLSALRSQLQARFDEIDIVLNFMDLMHCAGDLEPEKTYTAPSINLSKQVLGRLSRNGGSDMKPGGGFSAKSIQNSWSRARPSVAFLYAASHVETKKGNLLERIASGRLTYRMAKRYLKEWFGKANFVTFKVLRGVKDNTQLWPAFPQVAGVDPLPFKFTRAYSISDQKLIAEEFRKKPRKH